jgi:hypothetical protein
MGRPLAFPLLNNVVVLVCVPPKSGIMVLFHLWHDHARLSGTLTKYLLIATKL